MMASSTHLWIVVTWYTGKEPTRRRSTQHKVMSKDSILSSVYGGNSFFFRDNAASCIPAVLKVYLIRVYVHLCLKYIHDSPC
jgi:hypothetical protein